MNRKFRAGSAFAACVVLTAAAVPAHAVERNLVGVAIYSTAQQVIRKYGNPTYVLTSGQTVASAGSAAPGGAPFGGGSPLGGGAPFGGSGPAGGLGPLPPMAPPSGPAMPEFQGGGNRKGKFGGYNPGSSRAAYAPQQPAQSTAAQTTTVGEVTYVYQKSDGTTYQFLLSPNGKVIQITALGRKPQDARTSRGITLGSTYSQVLAKYGNPETIEPSGGITLLMYADRAHVAFQLVANKVVSINVGAVE